MSKRTRHGDNSKRMQPVQQQRAAAARLASTAVKAGKRSEMDGKGVAELDYVAKHDGMIRQPALTFTVPAQLRRLRLHGKLIPAKGKPARMVRTLATCSAFSQMATSAARSTWQYPTSSGWRLA